MTTVHANAPQDTLRRIETMAMMDDTGLPLKALRAQTASAIDLIVQVDREADGRRRVTEIAEVLGLTKGGGYLVKKTFPKVESPSPVSVESKMGGANGK